MPKAIEKAVQNAISGPPAPAPVQPAPANPAEDPQTPPAPAAPVEDAAVAPAPPAASPVVILDEEITLPIGEFRQIQAAAAQPSRITVTCTVSDGIQLDAFVVDEATGTRWAAGERSGIKVLPGMSACGTREVSLTGSVPAGTYSVIIDNTAFTFSTMPPREQPGIVKAGVTVTLKAE
ncbi:MAG: hypothetical protein ABIF71_01530 [Planctomycetota bacterium]